MQTPETGWLPRLTLPNSLINVAVEKVSKSLCLPLPLFCLYFLPTYLPRSELLLAHFGDLVVYPEGRSSPTVQCYSSLVHLHRKNTVWLHSEQRPPPPWLSSPYNTDAARKRTQSPGAPQLDGCTCACAAAALELRGSCSSLVPQGPSLHVWHPHLGFHCLLKLTPGSQLVSGMGVFRLSAGKIKNSPDH